MREKMHPIYTEIPQRSYDALARSSNRIEDLLLALRTDPLAAEDVAEQLAKGEMEAHGISPRDFADLGANAAARWKITLGQWSASQVEARPALRELTRYDHRVGAWCVCKVAREALRYIPMSEAKPLQCLEVIEQWVANRVTDDLARDKLRSMGRFLTTPSEYAGEEYNARRAILRAADVVIGPEDRRHEAATVVANWVSEANRLEQNTAMDNPYARGDYLLQLRYVVAEACLSFPI